MTAPAMTVAAACTLAAELTASAPAGVTVTVETYVGMGCERGADGRLRRVEREYGRLVMSGGKYGQHALELEFTSEARARAHVAGYVETACGEVNAPQIATYAEREAIINAESAARRSPGVEVKLVAEQKPAGKLEVAPMTISAAKQYIKTTHRHHRPPVSGLFAVGVRKDGELVGVLIVGRPVARMTAQDPYTVEATRCATDGSKNAVSMLYSAAWRAARALGYRRLVTYTLPEEGGASMRACGFTCVGEAGGGSWSRKGREREDQHPTQRKLRWEAVETKVAQRAA